jgi:hypothetical protein
LAYWYLIYPLHQLIFAGMLRGIVAASLREGKQAWSSDKQPANARTQSDCQKEPKEPFFCD